MKVTDAGTTIVISEIQEAEKGRILAAVKAPEEAPLKTLTRKEIARIFGVHPGSVKRWDKAGKITPIRINARTIRYSRAEVEALISGEVV